MKIVIPVAGRGTRLRPHTFSKPKPLVLVGGKPMLGHILDEIVKLNRTKTIDELIFITGPMEGQIRSYVTTNYDFPVSFIPQKELLGDGHAVHLAHDHITEQDELMIIFSDTLFEADLSVINNCEDDGIVWTKTVANPQRFGIVVTDNQNIITDIVEKPDKPISNNAIVGLYYLKNGKQYMDTLKQVIDQKIRSKNEFRNADALQLMIQQNARLRSEEITVWADCGTKETLLETNRWLLKTKMNKTTSVENSLIIEPVYIEEGVKITHSIVGPYVTVTKGTAIDHCIIENSIIDENCTILNAELKNSLLGKRVMMDGLPRECNLGDNAESDRLGSYERSEK